MPVFTANVVTPLNERAVGNTLDAATRERTMAGGARERTAGAGGFGADAGLTGNSACWWAAVSHPQRYGPAGYR
jgi:hypothetical protein